MYKTGLALLLSIMLTACGFKPHQLSTTTLSNQRVYVDYHGQRPQLKHTLEQQLQQRHIVTTKKAKEADFTLHILAFEQYHRSLQTQASNQLRIYPLVSTLVYSLEQQGNLLVSNQRIIVRDHIRILPGKNINSNNQLSKKISKLNQSAVHQLLQQLGRTLT